MSKQRVVPLLLLLAAGCNAQRDTTEKATRSAGETNVSDERALRATAERVLGELALPVPARGELARADAWRVYLADSAPRLLYLMHEVAALHLPDGPITLEAPLTMFQFEDGRWQQSTQDSAAVALPEPVHTVLSAGFANQARTHFYLIAVIDLAANAAKISQEIRDAKQRLTREATALRRDGFIHADAAP